MSFDSSDILGSNGDGTYDISFFASSVQHTTEFSRSIFNRFSGKKYSELHDEWASASDEERQAFLLEHHESAHHGLLFSTPAGVLLWRINQVLNRDIHFVAEQLRSANITIPDLIAPYRWLSEKAAQGPLALPGIDPRLAVHLFMVVDMIDKVRKVRQVFFEPDAATTFKDLKIGELLTLLQDVYPYLCDRCGIPSNVFWACKLDQNAKVFPEGCEFNVMDIAECHAIFREVFLLRAMGDLEGVRLRIEKAKQGPFSQCIHRSIEFAQAPNEIGLNPHAIQMASVLACSAKIDLAQEKPVTLYIEEQLPWLIYGHPQQLSIESIQRALESLHATHIHPLFTEKSQWLRYYELNLKAPPSGEAQISKEALEQAVSNYLSTLASFSLDMQAFYIHRGLEGNIEFLLATLQHQNQPLPQAVFDEWHRIQFLNKAFVEYDDNLFINPIPLEDIFSADHPVRSLGGFQILQEPVTQMLGHLINGASVRRAAASYWHKATYKPEIIATKIVAYATQEYSHLDASVRDNVVEFAKGVTGVFRAGMDAPFGQGHLREISGKRFL